MKQCPKCDYPNLDAYSSCYKCQTPLDAQSGAVATASSPPAQAADACSKCGAHAEEGYAAPLCAHCRTSLSKWDIPKWVLASSFFVFLVVCYAISHFPATLNADIAYERGGRAEAAGDYARAVSEYRKVIDRFPDCTEVIARLGISYYHSGDIGHAIECLGRLDGREMSDDLMRELDSVVDEIDKKMGNARPAGGGN